MGIKIKHTLFHYGNWFYSKNLIDKRSAKLHATFVVEKKTKIIESYRIQ